MQDIVAMLADAILDRSVYSSYRIVLAGSSLRTLSVKAEAGQVRPGRRRKIKCLTLDPAPSAVPLRGPRLSMRNQRTPLVVVSRPPPCTSPKEGCPP